METKLKLDGNSSSRQVDAEVHDDDGAAPEQTTLENLQENDGNGMQGDTKEQSILAPNWKREFHDDWHRNAVLKRLRMRGSLPKRRRFRHAVGVRIRKLCSK
ncbi:hypothetical protein DM860_017868 [Cuscuta australis]|uniref:Uncharacterized protein n=1 Tax=Cuscuta australis TaxID=267555 RepID=A0A328DQV4_9ASTE|nr:hypothetical protein DM860_017868 [Cuscuta australis]